jgi:hypothetical protein
MLIRGITEGELQSCADAVGVDLYDLNRVTQNRMAWRCRIVPISDKFRKFAVARWYILNGFNAMHKSFHDAPKKPHRIHAICWHGHRDFMREIFKINPDASIRTSLAHYKGKDDFENKFYATRNHNISNSYYPLPYKFSCKCEKDGPYDWDKEAAREY